MSLNLDKSTWTRVKFGDVIDSVTDRVDNPSEAGVDRYVGLEHLDPGVLTVQRWGSPDEVEAQKLRFQPGDVIFGRRRAYQKKVALAEFEGICSAHALVLRARSEHIHPDFLPVFLSSDYFLDRAIGISVGSLSPTVNWRDLKVQEFDLPPLDEQKRIADLLWALEDHRSSVESARVIALTNLEGIRARAFEAPGERVAAREIFEITIGRQRSPRQLVGDHLIPYLRSANVTREGIDTSDVKSMNFNLSEQSKFELQVGDVLVSEASASENAVGIPAVWNGEIPGVVGFQNTLLRYRATPGVSIPGFVEQFCHWAFESGAFLAAATGTNIRHIGARGAASMKVRSLSLEEQSEVVREAVETSQLVRRLQAEHTTCSALALAFTSRILGGL